MELVLNDEQRLLKDSAERLVGQLAGPAALRAVRDTEHGFDRARHRAVAEAGWLAVMVPERLGGLGLGTTELALVLEQAGRGLMTEPVCAASVAAWAIGAGRAATGSTAMLEELVAGGRIILPALQDPAAPEEERERIAAMHYHYGYQLTGRRSAVPQAAAADAFLVDAATADGAIMVVVPGDLHGVSVASSATVDGTANGSVDFSEASTMGDEWLIAGAKQGGALAAGACDRLLLGTSAEMLGVMEAALELALGYVRTREQFGRPIGSFQALQHRAVDAHIQMELTRSLLFQACAAFDAGRGSRAMAAAVKARASAAVLEVTKSVIQMHGAIGFTDEYDAGLYLRRAMTLSARYGNAARHRARYAALADAEGEGAAVPQRPKRRKRRKSIFATS